MRLPAFRDAVDVRTINLEVVVTHRGERITGLRTGDFSIRANGQEIPIELFTEVVDGRAVPASESGNREVAGERVQAPPLGPRAHVGTRYVLFIDDDFAIPTSRNRVLEQLTDQLGGLGPRDRMAVVAFDGRRLELLSGWTRSLAKLASALDEARRRRAYGMLRRNELHSYSRGRYGSRPPSGKSFSSTGFLGLGRALDGRRNPAVLRYSDEQAEISQVVRAATSTLRGLIGVPGRKVMLLLAGGWPATPRWGDRDVFDRYDSQRSLFAPLIDTANQLGYTLYPVDVQGSRYGGITRRPGTRIDRDSEQLAEDTLHYLADETGGLAHLDSARLTALERTIEDTRSYYWLGFTPTWQGNDKEHRLEVRASRARPGGTGSEQFKVRTRRSFTDLSRQSQVSMWIESAHLFDAPLPDSTDLAVVIGEPEPTGASKLLLPLSLQVPLDQVTLSPMADTRALATRLELRIAATDADGASADIPIAMVEIVSETTPAPGQIGTYQTRLKLRRKPHRLMISLYDPANGKVLARRVDFEP